MSSLPTTEVMGSTPGRHLEITGEKNPGKVLMHVKKKNLKKCCIDCNILPIWGKNGGKKHANEEFQAIDINL